MIPKKIIDNSDLKLADFLNSILKEIPETQLDIATAFFNIQAYALPVRRPPNKLHFFRLL